MKRFIIWIVLCITVLIALIALGSISTKPADVTEINYHDTYLGAIHYNEYGVSSNESKQQNGNILLALCIPLLSYFLTVKKVAPKLPKIFLFSYVMLLKQHENLIPKLFHSNLFAVKLLLNNY